MRIRRVHVEPYSVALRPPLRTAKGTVHRRTGLILRIVWEDGIEGLGEAAPLPGFAVGSLADASRAIEGLASRIEGADLELADLDGLVADLVAAPTVRAAIDVAFHDAAARRKGARVADLLSGGSPPAASVACNALLDAHEPADVADQARRYDEAGFRTFKIKIGSGNLEHDLARAVAVRETVGARAGIRLDANQQWNEEDAARGLEQLAVVQPEYVEEPLRRPDPEALGRLQQHSGFPLAIDESLRCEADGERWLGVADVFVLKPGWLGGFRPTLRIAEKARANGTACVVTTAFDAAIGRAAALHLAAALDGPFASGLATGNRLAEDVASLAEPVAGFQSLPAAGGLGVTLH